MHLGAHSMGGLPVAGICSSPTISHNPARDPHEVSSSATDMLQVLIYQALGFQEPAFGHVSLILAPDKSKLSKRHGATSVGEFRAQGYLPEAMINYLSLLGWNDGTEQVSTTGLSQPICVCIARGTIIMQSPGSRPTCLGLRLIILSLLGLTSGVCSLCKKISYANPSLGRLRCRRCCTALVQLSSYPCLHIAGLLRCILSCPTCPSVNLASGISAHSAAVARLMCAVLTSGICAGALQCTGAAGEVLPGAHHQERRRL